jgi:transcriptional regulator with XRE-family HTH domain
MDKDTRQILGLIRDALDRFPFTGRALEDELGIGHGNLSHLLSGRLELKLRHLLSIARVLGVPPHRLVELGCPESLRAATRDVTDLVALPAGALRVGALTSEELEERIRAVVREELADFQKTPPATASSRAKFKRLVNDGNGS